MQHMSCSEIRTLRAGYLSSVPNRREGMMTEGIAALLVFMAQPPCWPRLRRVQSPRFAVAAELRDADLLEI